MTMNKRDLLKKYGHIFKQPVTLYENFNSSRKSLTEAKKDNILDQLDKEDYKLIKSIYPSESKMIIVGNPGNKKVFYIDFDRSGGGGYYTDLRQVFPKPQHFWNDEGEEYDEFLAKMPDAGYPKSRKEGEQQELSYLYSKYDRVLVIPKKKWLEIAQGEVPLDIDDTEPEEDELNPPVQFYYGVYELDNDGDELDHISDFNTEEEAIKFAKKQSFPTHVVFIPSIDPDDDPEIAEYMEYNAPYGAYEVIWSSLHESFKNRFGKTSKHESLLKEEDVEKKYIVITRGGYIGGNRLNGSVFNTKEQAQDAAKSWKNSFGKNRGYYRPQTSIYVYVPGKDKYYDQAVQDHKKYLKSNHTEGYEGDVSLNEGKVVRGRRLIESTSSEYTIQQVDENKIKELENGSAFTWEGMNIDDENLQAIVEFFKEQTPFIKLPVHFFTWNGDVFNAMYGLTGSNAYPDDLTFLSIDLDNWKEMGNLPMVKMRVGARWLDDIVDNNARKESREDTW